MAVTKERIVSTATTVAPSTKGADTGTERSGKKKKVLLLLPVLLLVVGGAVWFFLLRGGGAEAAPKKAEKGAVVVVDSVNINLAQGHYLKLGFALQLSKGLKEEPETSQALDIAIEEFSGRSMEKLAVPAEREKLWGELTEKIEKAYEEGAVIDVYKREFVMQ
jgi:flagellar FliL protein